MIKRLATALAVASVLGCASLPSGDSADTSAKFKTTLDQESLALLSFPEFEKISVSNDGKYIAISHRRNKRATISVMERASGKILTSKSFPNDTYVYQMLWFNNQRLVMATYYSRGLWMKGDRTHLTLYAMDYNGTNDAQIFPAKERNPGVRLTGGRFHIYSRNLIEGTDLVLSEFKFSQVGGEVMLKRVNIYDGLTSVLDRMSVGEDYGGLLADNNHAARVAFRQDRDKNPRLFTKAANGGSWKEALTWPQKTDGIDFIGFNKTNDMFYFSAENSRGVHSIYTARVAADGKMSAPIEFFASPKGEIGSVEWDYLNKEPVFVTIGGHEKHYFNKTEYSAAVKALDSVFPGEYVNPVGPIDEGIVFVVASSYRPLTSYIFDWKTLSARKFIASNDQVDPKKTSKAEYISYSARDGLKINGYLFRPVNAKPPFPLILNVHGGPFGVYDNDLYSGEDQFFTNKGYAVLKVNYRGSGGRGRAFEEAGYKKWGTAMQDDLADAALWAAKKGIADRERIGLFGGSYGGYAAAMSLLRFPDIFRCAVAVNGVYDMRLLGEAGDGMNSEATEEFYKKVLPASEEEKFKQSPVSLASTLKRPIYIMTGADDNRVPIVHAEKLTAEFKKAGKEFQYYEYPDMGHWFRDQDMLNHAFGEMLAFFDKNLKPKPAAQK